MATIKTGISVACTCEMRALRSIWGANGRGREEATSNQLRSLEYDSASIDVSRAIFIRIVKVASGALTTHCFVHRAVFLAGVNLWYVCGMFMVEFLLP